MASGITSIRAIERKRVPEKVIARSITARLLKHAREDTQFPNMVTYKKKTPINTSFTIQAASIIIAALEYLTYTHHNT
jgi:hypothetical protein